LNVERFPNPVLAGMPRPFSIADLPVFAPLRILVLAPHPDDFDAIGVTIRHLHRQGHRISVAVVSGSWSGVLPGFAPGADRAALCARREAEQIASVRFFGLPEGRLQFLRLREEDPGDPVEDPTAEAAILDCLSGVSPDWVFLPHGNDTNAGHQRVYRMFHRIAEGRGRPLAAFLICDPKTLRFRKDAYMSFGETDAAWKSELLRCHLSQDHRNRTTRGIGFDERILGVNRALAAEQGSDAPYLEAFELLLL
jgi:LmbE family N-acetylglucosaminyl deacetylase